MPCTAGRKAVGGGCAAPLRNWGALHRYVFAVQHTLLVPQALELRQRQQAMRSFLPTTLQVSLRSVAGPG
jgi:hypothetical protein